MNVKKVKREDLKLNTPFNYSFFLRESYPDLENSIRSFGVLSPIFVFERKGELIPFSGFKRIFFSKDYIPILFFSRGDDADYFKIGITENVSHRELNLIEISNLLFNLEKLGYDKTFVYNKIFPLIGVNPKKIDIDFFYSVRALPLSCKKFIASNRFSIKGLKLLFKFPEMLREKIFLFSKFVRFNTNQEIKFFRYMFELWKKGEDVENFFNRFEDFIKEDIQMPQKAKKVLDFLEKKKNPVQFNYKIRFYEFLKKMEPPNSLRVLYPESFEQRRLKIEVEITPDNLSNMVVFFKNLDDNNFFSKMDELI